jgi:protein TonB
MFRISLWIHGGILLALLIQGIFFPSTSKPYVPSLRVDLIGLPDQLKFEKIELADTPGKGAPSENSPTKPNEKTPDPEGMLPKTSKKPDSKADAQKRAKDALARIKALSRIKDDSETAGGTTVVKGNQLSKGTSLSADARESMETGYIDLLWDRLQENWALPQWLQGRDYEAQVYVTIDARGSLTGLRFLRRSGNAAFDDAVTQAVRNAQPFPPPPEELRSALVSRGVLLGFPR